MSISSMKTFPRCRLARQEKSFSRGVCVGRCYVNDPERSSTAFMADPLREGETDVTGAVTLAAGARIESLNFLVGRMPRSRSRGFRIEIGDIENALLSVEGVSSGAVVIVERPNGAKQLIAFYSGANPTSADLVQGSLEHGAA